MASRACVECHFLHDESLCPNCGSQQSSKQWSGYVCILDPLRSEIAGEMNIEKPGTYALKVR